MTLKQYEQNVYSQNGEDGIIGEIVRRLSIEEGYFIEFGAWDGKHLSNTYNLYENRGWTGCYIEGDRRRFADLETNIPDERIKKINAYVTNSGSTCLDALLDQAGSPERPDLLSIDIDSDDYAIWESVRRYKAKIVIVEYNFSIPNACHYVQPYGANKGNSARALVDLGDSKGYQLVAVTITNLIFVDNELHEKLNMKRAALEDLREDAGYIFHGYDGELITTGQMNRNVWTGDTVDSLVRNPMSCLEKIKWQAGRFIKALSPPPPRNETTFKTIMIKPVGFAAYSCLGLSM